MSGLTLTLLGGFEASLGDQSAVLPAKKARALLAYLAMNPDQPHSREKVASLLWGNSGEQQARANLRQTLMALRGALPQGGIASLAIDGDALSFDAAAAHVDVAAFKQAVAVGTPAALEQAAGLYRGELLEGFSLREPKFEEWLEGERAHLRRLAVAALTQLLDYY